MKKQSRHELGHNKTNALSSFTSYPVEHSITNMRDISSINSVRIVSHPYFLPPNYPAQVLDNIQYVSINFFDSFLDISMI